MTELQTIQSKIYELRGISSQFVMTSRAKRPKSALPLAFLSAYGNQCQCFETVLLTK